MPEEAVATVILTDLTGAFPDPWEVEISSLSVQDRLGLLGDTAALAFDQAPGEGWEVKTLADWPRSVRADISLGTVGGEPPVDHGPYYVRRATGTVMESGVAYSLGLSRASASTDMERILRASMFRQYAWVLAGDFSQFSPFTAQELREQQGFEGLVNALASLGLGVALAPLTADNFAQLQAVRLTGHGADLWNDSTSAAFLAGWLGIPVPFVYRLEDLFSIRLPDRPRGGYGVNLFDTSAAQDITEYDLAMSMGDLRRRNNLTENRANVRYTVKADDPLQRSELQQAGHTGVDVIPGPPVKPTVSGEDLLPPTLLPGEFPDGVAASLAVYGRAAQQSLEAVSATAEIDWNPYLRNGRLVRHSERLYRLIEISHDLGGARTTVTVVPVVSALSPF